MSNIKRMLELARYNNDNTLLNEAWWSKKPAATVSPSPTPSTEIPSVNNQQASGPRLGKEAIAAVKHSIRDLSQAIFSNDPSSYDIANNLKTRIQASLPSLVQFLDKILAAQTSRDRNLTQDVRNNTMKSAMKDFENGFNQILSSSQSDNTRQAPIKDVKQAIDIMSHIRANRYGQSAVNTTAFRGEIRELARLAKINQGTTLSDNITDFMQSDIGRGLGGQDDNFTDQMR